MIAGGGAAGLGVAAIVRELGCDDVLLPRAAGALSAIGAQLSDIVAESGAACSPTRPRTPRPSAPRSTSSTAQAAICAGLSARQRSADSLEHFVDARYAYQVWQLEIPVSRDRIGYEADVAPLSAAFHRTHQRVFAVGEPVPTRRDHLLEGAVCRRARRPALPPRA